MENESRISADLLETIRVRKLESASMCAAFQLTISQHKLDKCFLRHSRPCIVIYIWIREMSTGFEIGGSQKSMASIEAKWRDCEKLDKLA